MEHFKDVLQHELCNGLSFTGDHQMPRVKPYLGELPKDLISFNRARASRSISDAGIHFYIRDVFFECFWNSPSKYINLFRKHPCVISTDYSVYANMTMPEVMWNNYRNKLLAAWMQRNDIAVIPNVSWSREWSYDFCFEGMPKHSIIAINSTGIGKDAFSKDMWIKGYRKAIEVLEPIRIVRYGAMQDGELESISTYYVNDNRKGGSDGR